MTPIICLVDVLVPGLQFMTALLGPKPGTTMAWEDEGLARVLLLAIAGIESLWCNVAQTGGGPGRGFWQFEPVTVFELLHNQTSQMMMLKVCAALNLPTAADPLWLALMANTDLQVTAARLDLLCDPRPLPPFGDASAAWQNYQNDWRPGRPHPAIWDGVYAEALAADEAWVTLPIAPNPSSGAATI